MRKTVLWFLAASALTLGGGSLLACAQETSDPRPPVSQLKEGVNLLDVKDPSVGMNAAFVKNGRAVYVQTRIGTLKPDVYRQAAPNEPAHETDMRFVNTEGKTFYVQRGGDKYVDPTWQTELEASTSLKAPSDGVLAETDFNLARDAAQALSMALPSSFSDHTYHLSAFTAQPLPSEAIAKQALVTGDKGYGWGSWGAGAWTTLYSHQICFSWICPAYHSSTVTYTGNSQVVITSCNHGNCGPSGNNWTCSTPYAAYSGSVDGEGSGSNRTVSGGCNSYYNWNTPGGHECNDDSAYEMFQTYYGTPSTPYGNETNFNVGWNHNYACDCNINGCSGDWKTPQCSGL